MLAVVLLVDKSASPSLTRSQERTRRRSHGNCGREKGSGIREEDVVEVVVEEEEEMEVVEEVQRHNAPLHSRRRVHRVRLSWTR